MKVHIEIRNGVESSVARVQHFLAAADHSVSGAASEAMVRIIRIQRIGNSIFRPEFNGTITSTPDGCILHGNFRLSDQASGIIKAWFWGVIVLIICAAGMGIRTGYSQWWQVPLGGVGVLLAGFLFLLFAKYFYRGDEDWIAQQLRSLLGPGDASQRLNVAPTAVTRE
jgi:hypothetical protein